MFISIFPICFLFHIFFLLFLKLPCPQLSISKEIDQYGSCIVFGVSLVDLFFGFPDQFQSFALMGVEDHRYGSFEIFDASLEVNDIH